MITMYSGDSPNAGFQVERLLSNYHLYVCLEIAKVLPFHLWFFRVRRRG